MTNWTILNISPTDDREAIRRAYMSQLPKYNPEDNPEGFARLRTAYEEILKELDNPQTDETAEDTTPMGLFIKRLDGLYNDFDRRRDIDEWAQLLKDEVCVRLDMEDIASEQMLIFLMNHHYIPHQAWVLLDNHFEWKDKMATLKQTFPPNFIDFAISNTQYESLKYDLFTIDPDYLGEVDTLQYDRWMWLYYEMEIASQIPGDASYLEMKQEIEALPIRHVYYDLQVARALMHKEEPERPEALKQALAIAKPIYEAMPDDIRARYIYAQALLVTGHAAEALNHFEDMLEQYPDDFASQKGIIDALIELGDYEDARGMLLGILDKFPYNPYALQTFRIVTEKLMEVYEEKYAQNPNDEEIVLTLAKHYLNSYHYDKCQHILEKKEYEQARYYEYLADCYAASGDLAKADQLYDKNIVLEKKHRNYVKFITLLIDAGKFDKAAALIDEALQLEGEDQLSLAYLHDNKGLILHQQGNFSDALASFDKGLEINSQAAHIYIHKARTYQHTNRYSEAIDSCDQAIITFPYTTEAYTIQMEIFYNANLFDRMLELSDRADQVAFESPRIKYHKACALRMLGKLDESKAILNELLEAEFDEGYRDFFHVEAAYLTVTEGDYEAAFFHITNAIELSNEYYPYRHVFLGNVHRFRGEFAKALEIYNSVKEKHPEIRLDDEIASCIKEIEIASPKKLSGVVKGIKKLIDSL
ncbi:MAG: tetratricopeptide repeat protein [Defluviitaleaceae bacterium]|nr:tetratricopeptide repeat protein [Defluviitaleaceae bacterium]